MSTLVARLAQQNARPRFAALLRAGRDTVGRLVSRTVAQRSAADGLTEHLLLTYETLRKH
jgi:hypothetical protein